MLRAGAGKSPRGRTCTEAIPCHRSEGCGHQNVDSMPHLWGETVCWGWLERAWHSSPENKKTKKKCVTCWHMLLQLLPIDYLPLMWWKFLKQQQQHLSGIINLWPFGWCFIYLPLSAQIHAKLAGSNAQYYSWQGDCQKFFSTIQ